MTLMKRESCGEWEIKKGIFLVNADNFFQGDYRCLNVFSFSALCILHSALLIFHTPHIPQSAVHGPHSHGPHGDYRYILTPMRGSHSIHLISSKFTLLFNLWLLVKTNNQRTHTGKIQQRCIAISKSICYTFFS